MVAGLSYGSPIGHSGDCSEGQSQVCLLPRLYLKQAGEAVTEGAYGSVSGRQGVEVLPKLVLVGGGKETEGFPVEGVARQERRTETGEEECWM